MPILCSPLNLQQAHQSRVPGLTVGKAQVVDALTAIYATGIPAFKTIDKENQSKRRSIAVLTIIMMHQRIGQDFPDCGFGILGNISAHPIPDHCHRSAVTSHEGRSILKHAIDGPLKALIVKKPPSLKTSLALVPGTTTAVIQRFGYTFCGNSPWSLDLQEWVNHDGRHLTAPGSRPHSFWPGESVPAVRD